jgi:hypothetical protein
MPAQIEDKELEMMENLTSNLDYDEFRWILSELRIPVTRFAKNLKISPSTLQLIGDKDDLMPLYIIDKLLEDAESPVRLLFLRNKYKQVLNIK